MDLSCNVRMITSNTELIHILLLNIIYHIMFQVSKEMEDSHSYLSKAEKESKA